MWLIHTRSLELKYFVGDNIPPYAILYHTWGDEEVTFQDWQDLEKASQKKGFAKIQSACAQALGDRLSYIWVDTNCIDKSSSAELSEAINSMFAWYSDSQICYVYLADVEDLQKFLSSFCGSRWFTRGWTLQELLAPRAIRFLAQNWKPIEWQGYACDTVMNPWERSHKSRQRLILRLLAHRTGIELKAILYSESVMSSSIVERMSWMKGRETTREEDLSYCLLGIFDINMPLLYGEGSKAFMRLQEEIIKQSTDQSLFAW
ncbi:HET-domain-containing protein, partial [Mollisia scopiformis]